MADISAYIAAIESAARGEEVRDSIVDALNGINNDIVPSVESALDDAKESGDFDGKGIASIVFNPDYTLTITMDDMTEVTTTSLRGVAGQNGANGISPTVAVSSITGGHRITITDAEHPSGQNIDLLNGADGQDGAKGDTGDDGISPTVLITTITGGHRVTITDADHTTGQSFDIMDGADGDDGNDGVSPSVSISSITGGHRVTITDAQHPQGQSFDVMDGSGGGGGGSGDMQASIYDPDNDVAAAGGIPDYVSQHAQQALTFDEAPLANSTNPVKSRGIYTALNDCQTKMWTTTITLTTGGWNNSEPYEQSVSITGTTANSMIDIQPDATAISQLASDNVKAIWVENDNGTIKVKTIGAKPTTAISLQCSITEVSNVAFPSYNYSKWIESVSLNNDYTLTINFTNNTSYTTPSIRGATGATGATGETGATGATGNDGVSPEVSTTTITNGHRVTITDALHPTGQSFDVLDGAAGNDGVDGYSPTITISTITGGHRVTITDAEHLSGQSFDVLDGNGSGDMQASVYDPNSTVANAGGIPAFIGTKVTSITNASTDAQYPTAAAVYALFTSITNANGVSY